MGAPYATPADFAALASHYAQPTPADLAVLLTEASRDLEPEMGARDLDVTLLAPAQQDALARATVLQALYRLERDPADLLGADNVASVEGVSFAREPLPTVSPLALAALSGYGLLRRSGTVPVG